MVSGVPVTKGLITRHHIPTECLAVPDVFSPSDDLPPSRVWVRVLILRISLAETRSVFHRWTEVAWFHYILSAGDRTRRGWQWRTRGARPPWAPSWVTCHKRYTWFTSCTNFFCDDQRYEFHLSFSYSLINQNFSRFTIFRKDFTRPTLGQNWSTSYSHKALEQNRQYLHCAFILWSSCK